MVQTLHVIVLYFPCSVVAIMVNGTLGSYAGGIPVFNNYYADDDYKVIS